MIEIGEIGLLCTASGTPAVARVGSPTAADGSGRRKKGVPPHVRAPQGGRDSSLVRHIEILSQCRLSCPNCRQPPPDPAHRKPVEPLFSAHPTPSTRSPSNPTRGRPGALSGHVQEPPWVGFRTIARSLARGLSRHVAVCGTGDSPQTASVEARQETRSRDRDHRPDVAPLLSGDPPYCIWSETGRTAEDDARDLRRAF